MRTYSTYENKDNSDFQCITENQMFNLAQLKNMYLTNKCMMFFHFYSDVYF